MTNYRNPLLAIIFFAALVSIWEFAVTFFEVPSFILPTPSAIAEALYRGLRSGLYLHHAFVTVFEVASGFVLGSLFGFALGVLIAQSEHIAYFLKPYIIALQSTPKIALAPLIVLWFGLGMSSKIISAALVTFFPLMINTISGLQSADEDRINLIKSLGGSSRQVFFLLRLPSALPFVMAGLEIGLTLALIGTVVAEFIGAEEGLGMLMQSMNSNLDIAGSFSVLAVLSIVGLLLNKAIGQVRRRVLFWEPSQIAHREVPEEVAGSSSETIHPMPTVERSA